MPSLRAYVQQCLIFLYTMKRGSLFCVLQRLFFPDLVQGPVHGPRGVCAASVRLGYCLSAPLPCSPWAHTPFQLLQPLNGSWCQSVYTWSCVSLFQDYLDYTWALCFYLKLRTALSISKNMLRLWFPVVLNLRLLWEALTPWPSKLIRLTSTTCSVTFKSPHTLLLC